MFFVFFQSGMYFLQLVDTYSATYALLALGITLCLALGWTYGKNETYYFLVIIYFFLPLTIC